MSDFRTEETHDAYEAIKREGYLEKQCPLCTAKTIKKFLYWRIIANRFPYDRISKKHDMIVPLRHVTESNLNSKETKELFEIKRTYLNDNYVFILEALASQKSIPEHFHLHVLVPKSTI